MGRLSTARFCYHASHINSSMGMLSSAGAATSSLSHAGLPHKDIIDIPEAAAPAASCWSKAGCQPLVVISQAGAEPRCQQLGAMHQMPQDEILLYSSNCGLNLPGEALLCV